MLRRYVKAGVLAVALVILAFEGYLSYLRYDRYYNYEAATGNASVLEGTTGDAGSWAARETGDAAPKESTGETTFSHTATGENSRGVYTSIRNPGIDEDDPDPASSSSRAFRLPGPPTTSPTTAT